jgi:Zn-dependent M28 family amino/carboxypeptidase
MRELRLLVVTIFAVVPGVNDLDAQIRSTVNGPTAAVASAHPRAAPERIRAHVKVLAGDRPEERTADPHSRDAADYIARQFALYGLSPAGDNGTYFQEVPMTGVRTLGETSFTVVTAGLETLTLRHLEDFITNNESQTESAYIDAPIVFGGYGIQAPESDWDDYKQTDFTGKVALLLANEPPSSDPKSPLGKAPTHYGSAEYKFEETARRGAIATLIIHGAQRQSDSWKELRNSWGKERFYVRTDPAPQLSAASWIESQTARKLVAMAGFDLDELLVRAQSKDFRPIELPLRLQAHVASQWRAFASRNVLAALLSRGARSQEAVLYTAHYGPLVDSPATGRQSRIINDATSCGALLEVARAWSQTASVPPRTIMFAALTGENRGLLGSQYLGKHSPVPVAKISLSLNYDALAPIANAREVEVSGAERTTFYSAVEAIAKTLRLAIRPDPRANAGAYYSSSSLGLAQVGIPSFSIADGSQSNAHNVTSSEHVERPHRRSADQYIPAMEFAGDAKLATFGYQLGLAAASQPTLIGWLPGDEFASERKRSQLVDQAKSKALQRKPKRRK